MFSFTLSQKISTYGRTGIIHTSHGDITTPVFMPVGTAASVKSLSPQDLEDVGAQIILANNYHLYLRPGAQVIRKFGGIHSFMRWSHPILTDSGGFQIQSLAKRLKITDTGVQFQSHIDGSLHQFTPEVATKSQIDIGADIIMAFDQSIPPQANRKLAETAVARTHAWLTRCIAALPRSASPALFGIIQGGQYPDLLRQSAEFVVSQRLPGIAVGGAVIGQDPHQTAETIATIRDLLPKELPLYAMGVGVRPSDLVSVIQAGADMFDCVAPTRLARTGLLYHPDISKERINISQAKFKLDKQPIFSGCDCSTCANYSRGYLHHLFKSHELLYYRLASIHNLRVMIKTVNQLASTSSPSSA